jgi:YegS/Rv2252/BmrU family lipid kinase
VIDAVPTVAINREGAAEDEPATPTGPTDDWLAIVNPAAGRGRGRRGWTAMEQALRRAGLRCDVVTTSCSGDGRQLAADAISAGRSRIMVAGGDGSVHDVVNGIMLASPGTGTSTGTGQRNSRTPTLVALPLGTGNDWSRSLRLPDDPASLAEILRRDEGAPHDVGRVTLRASATGGLETHWFVNVAGAGFDAHVIARLGPAANTGLGYLRGALRELGHYRSPRFRLQLDDATIDGKLLLAFVANGQYCGRGMHVAPVACSDDGRFDVVTIAEVGLARALTKLARLYRGTILQDALVQHHLTARLRIEAEPAVAVEADGQLLGVTPAEFSIVPRALRVLHGA